MPHNIENYLKMAQAAYQKRSYDLAIAHLREAHRLEPDNADILHSLGTLHDHERDYAEAARCYRLALEAAPDNASIRRGLAALCFAIGRHDESRDLYAELIRRDPLDCDAHFAYSRLTAYAAGQPALDALMIARRKLGDLPVDAQIKLLFTLGKARQDMGEYAEAFDAFKTGNELHYRCFPFDEAQNGALLDDVMRCFTKRFVEGCPEPGVADSTPVFVLGMPRSGSTLVEQILASHSGVATAGEVKYLQQAVQTHLIADRRTVSNALPGWSPEALRAAAFAYLNSLRGHGKGRARVIDKLPGNFAFVGLIHLMLPNAKIVHTVRHPMATLWSNYSTHFGNGLNYTYDLDVLTRYIGKYRAMMRHWRSVLPDDAFYDLDYERLVRAPETTLHDLFDYLSLDWEPNCLEFHSARREIKTASVAQVRRPLYSTSVDLWRNYETELRPFEDRLG